MRARGALVLVAVAACYEAPAPPSACAITCIDECPGDLACVNGFCVEDGEVCTPVFRSVSAGAGYACALDDGGRLWCWGSNAYHQIDPGDRPMFELPTRVGTEAWDAVATGRHTCGVADDGRLLCWGANDRGQVTGAISGDVTRPLEIQAAGGPTSWTRVAASHSTTCAIGDGRLFCWGAGDSGLLGNGSTADAGVPTPVMTELADWTEVAIGWGYGGQTGTGHACAISASTGLWCWGSNGYGELGNNTSTPSLVPVQIALPSPPTSVAPGTASTCATTASQELYCWGYAYDGALGDPALIPTSIGYTLVPTRASGLPGWTRVASAERWVCGLRNDETWCWGANTAPGLGNGIWGRGGFARVADGATDLSVGISTNIENLGSNTGDLILACIVVEGEVRCWGDNRYGQLGQGSAAQSAFPVEVTGGHVWSSIVAGSSHVCGVAGGDVLCWGSTVNGQANGVISGTVNAPCGAFPGLACDVLEPARLPQLAPAQQVALGANHTCALGSALTCWGDDGAWQLGGQFLPPTPIEVPGAWTSLLAVRGNAQCARQSDQTYCWGSMGGSIAPTHFPALDSMTSINTNSNIGGSNNYGHGCYLDQGGQLFCFGDNSKGQFGNGRSTGLPCNGNGRCDAAETSATCSSDCGPPPMSRIGRTYRAISVSWGSSEEGAFTCGVLDSGGVECWGRNRRSMLSSAIDPSNMQVVANVYDPLPVAGLTGCTAVSAGDVFACAMCGGDLWCWGDHRRGAIGAGPVTATPVTVPRRIETQLDGGDAWAELAAGAGFACARTTLGRAYCWGANIHGAIGTGVGAGSLPTPLSFAR